MSGLLEAGSLKEFFKALLEEVIPQHRLKVAEVTEFYLVNLLSDFAASERLFRTEDGKKEGESLALLYAQAQSQGRDEQIRTLRRLGDVSLYTAGFFSDSLERTAVGRDYYIDMGGAAYRRVASLAHGNGVAGVYQELCDKFRALVDVLTEISARGMVSNGPSGTLKVYESWARTGNDRLEKVLVDAGVFGRKGPRDPLAN